MSRNAEWLMSGASVGLLAAGVAAITAWFDLSAKVSFTRDSLSQLPAMANGIGRIATVVKDTLALYSHDHGSFILYGVGAIVVALLMHRL